jgi:NADH:ubiquinone oxidoreductase subunit D
MMTSYIRIGGLALPPPRGWQKRVKKFRRFSRAASTNTKNC